MPLAPDATANGSWSSGTTYAFNHTCTGSNLALFLLVAHDDSGSVKVSSATYGGFPLTFVIGENLTNAAGDSKKSEIWYLANPPTGLNSTSIKLSGSPTEMSESGTISLTGADGTAALIDLSASTHSAAGNISTTLQTDYTNDFLISSFSGDNSGTINADANSTRIYRNTTDTFTVGCATYRDTTGSPDRYSIGYLTSAIAASMCAVAVKPWVENPIIKPATIRPAMFRPGNAR